MKHLLLTTIAAVVLVGCGPSETEIALVNAAYKGSIEEVKQHLAAGVDVNAKDKMGTTPLHYAAGRGHREIAELLIAKGADVNAKDEDDETPLDYAEQVSEDDLPEEKASMKEPDNLIRKHGGKRGEELKAAESIWDAIEVGSIKAVKQHLTAGADMNAKDKRGSTPMFYAASGGHKEIVELLIAKGADVNAKNRFGTTPLRMPSSKEIAELLIDNGADVNEKDRREYTPLHYSAGKGYLEIAKLLISKGVDVEAKQSWGRTPLHEAAQQGHANTVKILIAKGANVNSKDNYGSTPLHGAAYSHDLETVSFLIEKGANINFISVFNFRGDSIYYGKETTPLDCVYANPRYVPNLPHLYQETAAQKAVPDILRKHGGKTSEETASAKPEVSTLLRAIEKRDLELAKKLIEGGADIEERGRRSAGKRSATPLYFATYNVDPTMTKLLLENGANVHALDYQGEIPLHTAVYHSFPNVEEEGIKVIEMLLEHGSKVNGIKQFPEKFTPLDFAKDPNGKIADLLRKHGGKTGEELKSEGK